MKAGNVGLGHPSWAEAVHVPGNVAKVLRVGASNHDGGSSDGVREDVLPEQSHGIKVNENEAAYDQTSSRFSQSNADGTSSEATNHQNQDGRGATI